jgi:hypothetical protein
VDLLGSGVEAGKIDDLDEQVAPVTAVDQLAVQFRLDRRP